MSKRLHILFIEDDGADAELLALALRRAKFNFEWQRVDTEVEYLDKLGDSPDLIFSDCRMPSFSAIRALELLKERGLRIPFIIMSGSIDRETTAEAMRLGASDCLLKDCPGNLEQAVRRALGEEPGA